MLRRRATGRPGLLLAIVFSGLFLLPLAATAKYASLIMDAETGLVLHEANADTRNYPASLTKIMTLYMVFEALEAGDLKMGTQLSVSRRAAGQPPSKLALRAGSTISVRDAILALVTKSANDVATVIAENLAGSEQDFALRMTARARALGMASTTFRNASGLPNRGQLSTARDMATLALRMMNDFPQHYGLFSTTRFTYGDARYGNHNNLLKRYEGTDGIKTGYIRASGFNLVASVERNGRRLIGVVFGGRSARSRDNHMISLLDKGFAAMGRFVLADVIPPLPMHRLAATPAPSVVSSPSPGNPPPVIAQAEPPRRVTPETAIEQGSADPAPEPSGDWGVQVGAYASPEPARKVAHQAFTEAQHVLDSGVIKIVPLQTRSGRSLYRAQILGITRSQAQQACRLLESRSMDCMTLRMTGNLRLAANG